MRGEHQDCRSSRLGHYAQVGWGVFSQDTSLAERCLAWGRMIRLRGVAGPGVEGMAPKQDPGSSTVRSSVAVLRTAARKSRPKSDLQFTVKSSTGQPPFGSCADQSQELG